MKKYAVGLWMLGCILWFGFTSFAGEEMEMSPHFQLGSGMTLYLDAQGKLWYKEDAAAAVKPVLDNVERGEEYSTSLEVKIFLKHDRSLWGVWIEPKTEPGEGGEIKAKQIVEDISEADHNSLWTFRKGEKIYDISYERKGTDMEFLVQESEDAFLSDRIWAWNWIDWSPDSAELKKKYGEDTRDVVYLYDAAYGIRVYKLKTDGSLWLCHLQEEMLQPVKKIMEDVSELDRYYALKADGSLWQYAHYYKTFSEDERFKDQGEQPDIIPEKYLDHVQAGEWGFDQSGVYALTTDRKLYVWGGFIAMYDQPEEHEQPAAGTNQRVYAGYWLRDFVLRPVVVAENVERFSYDKSYPEIVYRMVRTDGSIWRWGQVFSADRMIERRSTDALKVAEGAAQ